MLKIGIIGKIAVSSEYLKEYEKNNNCNIVAISGVGKDTAKEYGIEKYFADYHELIYDSDIEAVIVTSLFSGYNLAVLEALRCEKHVLSEKGFNTSCGRRNETYTEARHRKDFDRIIDYINQNFRENINTTIVAKELFISRSYATVIFKKYSQKKINEYIGELRINYANTLLKQGKDITAVATESGFACLRTFNNVYKRVMGITPTQYIERKITKGE